jgi:hypothetical protein
LDLQGGEAAEIRVAHSTALPVVWAIASGLPQVSRVSNLFQGIGARGSDSGRAQGQLVGWILQEETKKEDRFDVV